MGFLDDELEEKEESSSSGFLEDVDGSTDINEETSGIEYKPEIYFQSSEDMTQVESESVHLIVTSPPYNVGWDYGSNDDEMDYADEYLPMLARVFEECYRVLVPGGRMVVNLPSLVREGAEGGIPLTADLTVLLRDVDKRPWQLKYEGEQRDIAVMQSNTDWKIREIIQWVKGFNTDGTAPNGSYPRPWGILLNNFHESAVVAQKPGDRDVSKIPDGLVEDSKIDKWTDELCDDVWNISSTSWSPSYAEGEDIPPFPEEFVKRCIAIWTYKEDTVLDPFAGRFTVGKVAKSMDRYSIGYELREQLEKDIREYTGMEQTGLEQW